jgi:hypothetical protein
MAARFNELFSIIKAQGPMTPRQIFYYATIRGLVERTDGGGAKVFGALATMRRAGQTFYD